MAVLPNNAIRQLFFPSFPRNLFSGSHKEHVISVGSSVAHRVGLRLVARGRLVVAGTVVVRILVLLRNGFRLVLRGHVVVVAGHDVFLICFGESE